MNKIRVYGLTCVLMLAAAFAAQATTIVLPTDEQLVAKAPVIVEGTVLSSTPVERNGAIWTESVIAVTRNVKGQTAETVTVRELGGVLDDRMTKVFGTPEFEEGKRVLLFLTPAPQGGYRTVDLFVGKFDAARTQDGRRLWLREDFAHDVTLLDPDFRPLEAKNVQREAEGFEAFVDARVAGRPGRKNYGLENPVLARDAVTNSDGSAFSIRSNFTLIAEPNVYRWFRFASGQAAQWFSSGTQPGYSGGGVSELQTAMDAWTSYTGAKILYTYGGSRSGPMGGLEKPNGANEVLFNDPLNEIAGSFDRSSGGVVGQGGFNGVSSQQNFTATFTADEAHPAGSIRAWNITEGNLTIQDGVSSANGISSNRLAEILSHEFGHTLGFGHSADSSALMYYSVTGLGPALRGDDQTAARWLYPNGNSNEPLPPAPAAPSNLTASVSGNEINLSWIDNATNETGQSVYMNGSKVTDLAANVVTTRLTGAASGTHTFYVIATNSGGSSARSNDATVTVAPAPTEPTASFTVTPDGATAGQMVQFTSTSTGLVESLTWNFGDGSTTTGLTALHAYAAAGQYTVTLSAKGGGKTSVATRIIKINAPLTPSFVFSPSSPKAGDRITFTDQSGGAPTSWAWNFGDGTSSTEQNPSKQYNAAGNYTVTLTIGRNANSAAGQRVVTVTGSSVPVTPAVVAAFDMSTANVAPRANVTFTDRSSGGPTRWEWSFGDGATSSAQNPVHSYAGPGTYPVTLTVWNATTSSFASQQVNVSTVAAYRTLVSAAAQTAGVGGTSWRTELNIFNAGAQGADVTLLFIPSAGGSVMSRSLFLSPKQSRTYANALLDVFGIGSGAGAIALEASSAGVTADLRVTSRTFTTGALGTYGQAIPNVMPEALERTLYVTGMTVTRDYRTNVGLVNRDAAPVTVTLTLHNSIGTTLGTKTVTLAANSFEQQPLSSHFPVIDGGSYDVLTLRVMAASRNAVSAYASVIDNRTQDPIYLQAVAPSAGNSAVVPVVGRAPGANGTFWRSDVTLFNPSSGAVSLTLRYNDTTQVVTLGGFDTETIPDVLSRFGLTAGTGALYVSWDGGSGPVVTSRTYTSVANGGTYGQSVDAVEAFGRTMYVPGLRNDSSFRSNVGVVNGGSETEVVTLTLLSPFGSQLGRTTVTVAPKGQLQWSVTSLFPNADLTAGFTMHVEGDPNAQLFAYGSIVDNASGDPVFFGGR